MDAGCGSGLLSRHLKDISPKLDISACDFSELRLQQAKNIAYLKDCYKEISFFHTNLDCTPFKDNAFDLIICRYVYEYLPNPIEVTKEFYRVLKEGGQIILVDLDGVMLNLATLNKEFNILFDEVKRGLDIDLYAGRKLSLYLNESNFSNIKRSITSHDFREKSLEEEFVNNKRRLSMARPSLEKILGKEKTKYFINQYLIEMKKESSTLFHNKFIVSAIK